MRCKACDRALSDTQQWFFLPAGATSMVPETLCTMCLSTIRPSRYDKLSEDDDDITLILGTRYVETPDEG